MLSIAMRWGSVVRQLYIYWLDAKETMQQELRINLHGAMSYMLSSAYGRQIYEQNCLPKLNPHNWYWSEKKNDGQMTNTNNSFHLSFSSLIRTLQFANTQNIPYNIEHQ